MPEDNEFRFNFKRLIIVGCGGTGTQAVDVLLHDKSFIRSFGIKSVFLVDGDIVEEPNLPHQFLYNSHDLQHNKAEILCAQLRKAYTEQEDLISFNYSSKFIESLRDIENLYNLSSDKREECKDDSLVLSCVDNVACRRLLAVYFYSAKNSLLLDFGSTGKQGSIRVYYNQQFPCFNCTEWLFPEENSSIIPVCMPKGQQAIDPNDRIILAMNKLDINRDALLKSQTNNTIQQQYLTEDETRIAVNKGIWPKVLEMACVTHEQLEEFLYKIEVVPALSSFNSLLVSAGLLMIISGEILLAPFFMINVSLYGLRIKPIVLERQQLCQCSIDNLIKSISTYVSVDRKGKIVLIQSSSKEKEKFIKVEDYTKAANKLTVETTATAKYYSGDIFNIMDPKELEELQAFKDYYVQENIEKENIATIFSWSCDCSSSW